MKKKIVNTGGESVGVRFTIFERELYDIEENDIIDIPEKIFENKFKKRENDGESSNSNTD